MLGAKAAQDDFPDLAAAAKVKESKKDKKKKESKQKLSLTDFLKSDVGGGSTAAFGAARRGGGGGDVDLLSLPTAPRPRAEGEEPAGPRLGGAFGGFGGREGERRQPKKWSRVNMLLPCLASARVLASCQSTKL